MSSITFRGNIVSIFVSRLFRDFNGQRFCFYSVILTSELLNRKLIYE